MILKEHIAHSGAWGIALIVIVFASWFLYRYLAPKATALHAERDGKTFFFCGESCRKKILSTPS